MVLVVYEQLAAWKSPKTSKDDFNFVEFQRSNPVVSPPIAGSFYAVRLHLSSTEYLNFSTLQLTTEGFNEKIIETQRYYLLINIYFQYPSPRRGNREVKLYKTVQQPLLSFFSPTFPPPPACRICRRTSKKTSETFSFNFALLS